MQPYSIRFFYKKVVYKKVYIKQPKIKKVLIYNLPKLRNFIRKSVRKCYMLTHLPSKNFQKMFMYRKEKATLIVSWSNYMIYIFKNYMFSFYVRSSAVIMYDLLIFIWYISIFWFAKWFNLEKVLRKFYMYFEILLSYGNIIKKVVRKILFIKSPIS